MAHELSLMADGTYTMARAEGTDPSWHGLENVIPEYASFETWLDRSGMDFNIERSPVYFRDQFSNPQHMSDKHVLYRDDKLTPLSIVSADYHIVQPREVLHFFQDLCDKNSLKMDTAGVIKGGVKFWALASTGHAASIGGNDMVKQYILLASSADASMATVAKHTSLRVVCSNTFHLNVNNKEASIKVNHSKLFNADDVKVNLGLLTKDFNGFIEEASEMHSHTITIPEARRWYAEMLSGKTEMTNEEVMDYSSSRLFGTMMDGYTKGKGAEETVWGLFNGVTHTVDHIRGRSLDNRLDSSMFGTGALLKQKAWNKALEMITA